MICGQKILIVHNTFDNTKLSLTNIMQKLVGLCIITNCHSSKTPIPIKRYCSNENARDRQQQSLKLWAHFLLWFKDVFFTFF